ncbi:IgGFc-binding protein, partial [Ophiophagus hannah]
MEQNSLFCFAAGILASTVVYELCGTRCAATCENPRLPLTCRAACGEGCICRPGFILNGNLCIPLRECVCEFEGIYYKKGEEFFSNVFCRKHCRCMEDGTVQCHDFCSDEDACKVVNDVSVCFPREPGTCYALDGWNYVTFDGVQYSLPVLCSYILAQSDERHKFSIVLSAGFTGIEEVKIQVSEYNVVLQRGKAGEILVRLEDVHRYQNTHWEGRQTQRGTIEIFPSFVSSTCPYTCPSSYPVVTAAAHEEDQGRLLPISTRSMTAVKFKAWGADPACGVPRSAELTWQHENGAQEGCMRPSQAPFSAAMASCNPLPVKTELVRAVHSLPSSVFADRGLQEAIVAKNGARERAPPDTSDAMLAMATLAKPPWSDTIFDTPDLDLYTLRSTLQPFLSVFQCQHLSLNDLGPQIQGRVPVDLPLRSSRRTPCPSRRPYTISGKWEPNLFLNASSDEAPTTSKVKLFHWLIVLASGGIHILFYYRFCGRVLVGVAGEGYCKISSQRWDLPVNGERLPLPADFGDVSVRQEGKVVLVRNNFGLRVFYDYNDWVVVSVSGTYQGLLKGLCGNFNKDKSDEFFLPGGKPVQDLTEFGNFWKIEGGRCLETCKEKCSECDSTMEAKFQSKEFCGLIHAIPGPFSRCHAIVNPDHYFKYCVARLCSSYGATESLCQSLQAYAMACQLAGATIDVWRPFTPCGKSRWRVFMQCLPLMFSPIC